jgi:flagellar assembly factor FliW
MPQIQTKYFGPTEANPGAVYEFPCGLHGFETERSFVFLKRPDTDPLLFMQSLSDPNLCFLLMPILAADPRYQLSLAAEDRAALGLTIEGEPKIGTDILCAAVLRAGDEARPFATVNLLAPIVVNLQHRIGMQVIQSESHYSHQHPLLPKEEVTPCL